MRACRGGRTGFPVQYLGANVPQAWAAGSAFMLVQALLGLEPHAARGALYVDPWLPAWLPDLTLLDLRLGAHKLDLRFWRDGEATRHRGAARRSCAGADPRGGRVAPAVA